MTYFRLLADEGLNYTANRPLLDGVATDRVDTLRELASPVVFHHRWEFVLASRPMERAVRTFCT